MRLQPHLASGRGAALVERAMDGSPRVSAFSSEAPVSKIDPLITYFDIEC
jgi:hypothetical protein